MLECVVLPAREALDARHVVEHRGILRVLLQQLAAAVGGLGVLARLVQRVQRPPELPALRLIGLPRHASDRNDRRGRLLREGGPLRSRRHEDEHARRRVDGLAIDLEPSAPAVDEVELLVPVVGLVVLVEDPGARLTAGPSVDAEGRNAEVMSNRP